MWTGPVFGMELFGTGLWGLDSGFGSLSSYGISGIVRVRTLGGPVFGGCPATEIFLGVGARSECVLLLVVVLRHAS